MSFRDYFKDKLPEVGVCLLGWLLMLCFFGGFHDSAEQVIVISAVYFLTFALVLLLGFVRKAGFYKKALDCLDKLDKKYLLPEMLDEPSFYEGRLCTELLRGTSKSMCENVSFHKRQGDDFREFIELWVHEVKLPVASLLLMSHNDGEAGEKYTAQLTRVDDHIENVLYYARSENAEKDYIIRQVSLGRVFKDAALKNRVSLQQKNVTLTTDGLDKMVMTDSKWLEYIFTQLISNSLKYFAHGRAAKIEITADENDDSVTLHFKDNGIGISETDLPYIFEKTFTGENGRTHSKSTGMGLYIIKSLCKKLGHGIRAESQQGEWTDIIITFGKNELYRLT